MMYAEEALEHAIRLSHPTKTTKISAEQDVERCWRCGVHTGGKHSKVCIEEQKEEERKRKEEEEAERKKKEEKERKKKERERLRKKKERERERERKKKEKEKELLKQRTNEEKKNIPSYLPDATQSQWREGENVYWKRVHGRKKFGNFVFGTLIPRLETARHCVARNRRSKNKHVLLKKREGFDWRRKPSDNRLYVGDRVEAHFAVGWYYGSVTRVLEDGTYDIDYDDGDKERGVKRNLISYVGNGGKKKKKWKKLLSVGDRVSAHFDGKFHPCTITRVRNRREYDILYDDGDVETKKNIDLMRRIPTDDVRKANDDRVRKSNHDHVRKSNDKSDISSSYFETMLEPTAVSKSKRGRVRKQVKQYVGSFKGGKDWYEA